MRNSIKKYTVVAMAIGAMVTTSGCTDSWNEHFGDSIFGSGKSVWELIQEDPQLSTFAGLVKRAHYYRDEKHQSTYTFDELLDGDRSVTVWAPTNDALANDSDQWKAEAEALPYDFQKQFIMNHIAFGKYNMSQNDTVLRFRLINAKYATINPAKSLFGTANVVDKNRSAKNGLLNTVSNLNSYDNNVYEYIKYSIDPQLQREQEYIVSRDTIYYKPGSSIYGYPDEYGDPTVIDSVFSSTDNLLFGGKGKNSYLPLDYKYNDVTYKYMSYEKMFNIDINNEDSLYAMLTLTDAALKDGEKKMDKLYTYALHYPNMERMQSSSEKESYIEDVTLNTNDPDSLKLFNEDGLMNATCVFNLNAQPRDLNGGAAWTKETFAKERGMNCKFLLNTYGDTLRLDPSATTTGTQRDQTSLFKGCTSHVGSNGVSFVTDTWTYPESYYNPTIDINLNANSYRWIEYSNTTNNNKLTLYTVSGDTLSSMYKKICDDGITSIERNNFVMTGNSSTTAAHDIYFKLRDRTSYGTQTMAPSDKDVASTRYNIDLVVVPYYLSQGDTIPTSDLDTLNNKLANTFTATLYYYDPDKCETCEFSKMASLKAVANESAAEKDKYTFDYKGEKVQKIRLFTDFEFPVSYRDMIYTYPLLRIQTSRPKTKKTYQDPDTKKKTSVYDHTFTLSIDRIILTPVN